MRKNETLIIFNKEFEKVCFISKETSNLIIYTKDDYLKKIVERIIHKPVYKKIGGIENDICYDGYEVIDVSDIDYMTYLYEAVWSELLSGNSFKIAFVDDIKREYIDTVIKRIWKTKMLEDYNNSYLLYEDSLKNSLYYYLRTELTDLMKCTNIRIYPEYQTYRKENLRVRIDLAVVEINDFLEVKHLGDADIEILSAIEIKYKAYYKGADDAIISDVRKCISYLDELHGQPHVYLAVIQEAIYSSDDYSFFENENIKSKERISELLAFIPLKNEASEEMVFRVL